MSSIRSYRVPGNRGVIMSQMSYDQHLLVHQFFHPQKLYPTLDETVLAGIWGTPLDLYRQIQQELITSAHDAAEALLAQPEFAARVDRLPFQPGSTVVGLGDSITDDLQSWLELLRHLLALRRPQDHIRVVNAGISGDTTTQVIRRFLGVVAEQPDWIICMIGTNDATRHGNGELDVVVSPAETEKNLRLLRGYAARYTTARWVWITPYPVLPEKFSSHWALGPLQLLITNEDLDAVVEAVRRQPDPVVDLPQALGSTPNPEYLRDDGLHPSLVGHQAIVRALVESLT